MNILTSLCSFLVNLVGVIHELPLLDLRQKILDFKANRNSNYLSS